MKLRTLGHSLSISIFALSGCGNLNSVYRTHDFDQGAFIDIKQRAIITGDVDKRRVVCAEPSPDAMSSYAAEIAGKTKGVELTAAQQEAVAYVGLRSQSIQLLRDQMYRLCESYMNGVIDEADYQMLLSRNQRYTVALLAIEQLTGPTQAPAVTLTTNASSSIGENLAQTENDLKLAQEAKVKLEAEVAGDKPTAEQTKAIKAQQDEIDKLQTRLTDGKALAIKAVSSGQFNALLPRSPSSDATAAVKSIVEQALGNSDEVYVCFNQAVKFAKTPLAVGQVDRARDLILSYCNTVLTGKMNLQGSQRSAEATPLGNAPHKR